MDLDVNAPNLDALVAGQQIGKYRVLRRLAIGGMAEIYLAVATGIEDFKKIVVLKRILPQYAQNPDFRRMFLDEARLAARLHHQNIAQVYDIGKAGGSYFFTMEFVHGQDARRIMKEATTVRPDGTLPGMPIDIAVGIIINAAAGLHYAHDKKDDHGVPLNIVHRDVSPSNVLVTFDGGVKLVDFGIAKAQVTQTETLGGTLKGKIAYMSPEQCRGELLDRRSDIFSLGILLYEFTMRQRLFKGHNEFTILNQIVYEDIRPPTEDQPDYPRDLQRIVMRALDRDPDRRYSSAQELQLDLEQYTTNARLGVSSIALARYMRGMFGDQIDAWTEAQESGQSLDEHLTSHFNFEEMDVSIDTPKVMTAESWNESNPSIGRAPTSQPSTHTSFIRGQAAAMAQKRTMGLRNFVLGATVSAALAVVMFVSMRGIGGDTPQAPAAASPGAATMPAVTEPAKTESRSDKAAADKAAADKAAADKAASDTAAADKTAADKAAADKAASDTAAAVEAALNKAALEWAEDEATTEAPTRKAKPNGAKIAKRGKRNKNTGKTPKETKKPKPSKPTEKPKKPDNSDPWDSNSPFLPE